MISFPLTLVDYHTEWPQQWGIKFHMSILQNEIMLYQFPPYVEWPQQWGTKFHMSIPKNVWNLSSSGGI